MELKTMFDPGTKQEIISRINQLSPASRRKWGKMNVSQMLTHVQRQIRYTYGEHRIRSNFFLRILGPMFKGILYNAKPYKQGLPTDPSYVVSDERDFLTEKNNLLDLLGRFSEANISGKPHPIFGKISKEQWGLAIWKHLDHHLKQFGV
jgi:Protein of unknown function (DUF1569)